MLYGFLHLPTLIAFVDPVPRDPEILRVLQGGLESPECSKMLREGAPDRQLDLYHRLGAITHERRHFHDVLLTPHGNDLVRRGFLYSLLTIQLLVHLIHRSRSASRPVIALPLTGTSARTDLFSVANDRRKDFNSSVISGRISMEASATFAQALQVFIDFGETGHTAHLRWLLRLLEDKNEARNRVGLACHATGISKESSKSTFTSSRR
jgi:hypothetical protein